MKDKEKELKYLIHLKNEIIKQEKKELKQLRAELENLNVEKSRAKNYKKFK